MSNGKAPDGAIVQLYVDTDRPIREGDVVETRAGRGYQVLGVRVQTRGKRTGRHHLQCLVMGDNWVDDIERWRETLPKTSHVHRIRWHQRNGTAAGVKGRDRS